MVCPGFPPKINLPEVAKTAMVGREQSTHSKHSLWVISGMSIKKSVGQTVEKRRVQYNNSPVELVKDSAIFTTDPRSLRLGARL